MENKDFCVFILTHGRPDKIYTYDTIRKAGYTGKVYFIIDNEDKTAEKYYANYGKENVIMFDKKEIAVTFDEFDNFEDRRAIVYARNACFEIAKAIGVKYFLQLDDDYTSFKFRINNKLDHPRSCPNIKSNLDSIFDCFLEFFKSTPFLSIATSQGGDWFGGETNFNKAPKRKCMNTFFCSTDKPFKFIGRINEDVNTYTSFQSAGNPFLTIPFIQIDQVQTQKNKGGMTEIYLDGGTYIKSFYTIICAPSCTKINTMGRTNRRLHHSIDWESAVPLIINEKYKKN